MSTQAEGKFRAAKERLAAAPDDLAALREFTEASRGVNKRDDALAAMKAAYQRRPTPELYAELRSICTYPEFQSVAPPPQAPGAPQKQSATGAELLPRKPFPMLLDQTIFYPVQDGLSIFILICCALMIGVGNILWTYAGILGLAGAIILAGFPFAYFWTVVTSSGMGEKRTRGWPDVSDPGEMSEAFGRWFMVSIACFAPAVLFLIFHPLSETPLDLINILGAIGLGLLGVCYYPMALMLAGFTHDSMQIFNLPSAIRSIAKIPGDYMICLGFFVGVYVLVVAIEIFLNAVAESAPIPLWIALLIFSRVIDTYLVIVQMRTVGLLYYAREKDLGWFQ